MRGKNAWVRESFLMSKLVTTLLLFSFSIYAMELPIEGKLYAKDFEKLGVRFASKLLIDSSIDTRQILDAAPGYETLENIKKFTDAIKTGYEAPLYVKYVNAKLGYGAFADAPIKEHDIVGEYTGQLIDQETAVQLPQEKTSYLMASGNFYPGYNYPEELYIDAAKAGNFTRFVNHSYDPNVKTKVVYDGALWHVLFIAAKKVEQDKQLLVNYGPGYWQMRGFEPIELDQA